MQSRKRFIARIKSKLDEWDDELELLEQRALANEGDAGVEAERHMLALHEMLDELQMRIDELREMSSTPDVSKDAGWRQAMEGLEPLDHDLFAGN